MNTNNLRKLALETNDGFMRGPALVAASEIDRLRSENERLTKERDKARAQVAASRIAGLAVGAGKDSCGLPCGYDCNGACFAPPTGAHPPQPSVSDAQAALEAYGREKMRKGMQRAANIAEQCWESGYGYQTKEMILAEMEKLK